VAYVPGFLAYVAGFLSALIVDQCLLSIRACMPRFIPTTVGKVVSTITTRVPARGQPRLIARAGSAALATSRGTAYQSPFRPSVCHLLKYWTEVHD